ncbi:YiiX/YebB-like N1pC/P60 family cysteine hydrolase [Tepidimicrobium xylanilyticum]|uniref:Uncharacterized protein YycO n=1 Tax=Tepidimicrobium xylanilyticum TaxID=1123352 RepID=A0A1H3E0K4_9FIRM|nr:YiiX/YebB-like N1pC/P60 family cysteine hydrolase [Tepidimicrobium xylanilyticum]GMG97035.1 hypothetical protein EN5CB1_18610 [Tepidimicrobium xylanilyticum]SDX72140.1 Uncharacterized protein YycO [Tepidimicrobium xylanilyticum]
MRNYIKKLTAIVLVILLLLPGISFAAEQENYLTAEEVFTEDEVEKLEKKVDKKKLELDKGISSLNSKQSMGTYPRRKGVILVTKDKYKGIIPTGHAAIVYSYGTVVESLAKGVTTGANDWYQTRKTCYGVTVKGTTIAQDETAADWCYKQIGKPYNWNYLNPYTRNKFYCSQLIYAAFLDNYGINLDTSDFGVAIHPMELINSSNTIKIYER